MRRFTTPLGSLKLPAVSSQQGGETRLRAILATTLTVFDDLNGYGHSGQMLSLLSMCATAAWGGVPPQTGSSQHFQGSKVSTSRAARHARAVPLGRRGARWRVGAARAAGTVPAQRVAVERDRTEQPRRGHALRPLRRPVAVAAAL